MTNKGGRPPSPLGPMDASYTYRTNEDLKARFLNAAGPAELNKFMAWFLGDEEAELPERPCDAVKAA